MEVLLWLLPTVVVTFAAMGYAGWAMRDRVESEKQSEAAQQRFADAILREHPAAGLSRPRPVRDRSTGIAVRPSRQAADSPENETRRSA